MADRARSSDVWVACNVSIRLDLLLTHGGYDESFIAVEDAELAIRLWNAGVHFRFQSDLQVYEIYSKSANDLIYRDASRKGIGEVRLCRKQPDYRRYSLAARMVGRSTVRSLAARLCSAPAFSVERILLGAPFWIAQGFETKCVYEADRVSSDGLSRRHRDVA